MVFVFQQSALATQKREQQTPATQKREQQMMFDVNLARATIFQIAENELGAYPPKVMNAGFRIADTVKDFFKSKTKLEGVVPVTQKEIDALKGKIRKEIGEGVVKVKTNGSFKKQYLLKDIFFPAIESAIIRPPKPEEPEGFFNIRKV